MPGNPSIYLEERLSNKAGSKIEFQDGLGEKEKGIAKIQFTDRFEQICRSRVQTENNYRVENFELEIWDNKRPFSIYTTRSTFDEKSVVPWLPSKTISNHVVFRKNTLEYQVTLKISKVQVISRFPKDNWSLKSLDLPIGEPVADLRIKKRIGYWDGEKLSLSFVSRTQ